MTRTLLLLALAVVALVAVSVLAWLLKLTASLALFLIGGVTVLAAVIWLAIRSAGKGSAGG